MKIAKEMNDDDGDVDIIKKIHRKSLVGYENCDFNTIKMKNERLFLQFLFGLITKYYSIFHLKKINFFFHETFT